MTRRCLICGATRWVDPHHRRSKSRGGDNRASNIVYLCRQHHATLHQIMGQVVAPNLLRAEAQKKNAMTLMLKYGPRYWHTLPGFLQRQLPSKWRSLAEEK